MNVTAFGRGASEGSAQETPKGLLVAAPVSGSGGSCSPSSAVNSEWFSSVSSNFNSGATPMSFMQNGQVLNSLSAEGVAYYNADGTVNQAFGYAPGFEGGMMGENMEGNSEGNDENNEGNIGDLEGNCPSVGTKECNFEGGVYSRVCEVDIDDEGNRVLDWEKRNCGSGCCQNGNCIESCDSQDKCYGETYRNYYCDTSNKNGGCKYSTSPEDNLQCIKSDIILNIRKGNQIAEDELERFVDYTVELKYGEDCVSFSIDEFIVTANPEEEISLNEGSFESNDGCGYTAEFDIDSLDPANEYEVKFDITISTEFDNEIKAVKAYNVDSMLFVPFPTVVIS